MKKTKPLESFDILVKKSTEMLPILQKELDSKLKEKQALDKNLEDIKKQINAIKKFLDGNEFKVPAKRGRKKKLNLQEDNDGLLPITGKKLMENIYLTLKEHGPLHNKEILNYLREKGFKVAGSNPVANYFSHLSREQRITGTGKRGEYMVKPEYQEDAI